MADKPQNDPILVRFRAAVTEIYGSAWSVSCCSGRARGDASADSDYDVAVFLKDLFDRWAEADTLAVAITDILRETGAVIHAMPYPEGAYREATPLMHEIRREGLDL